VTQDLGQRLTEIYNDDGPPDAATLGAATAAGLAVLRGEPGRVRPADVRGRPGGLVLLDPGLPTVVVPDLHARRELFLGVLGYEAEEGAPVIELLREGRLQVVCLGDGFHAEGRAARRWQAALAEFHAGYASHQAMDEEMRESLGVMAMVMETKRRFPAHFHFLKGNHENISNESGGGNRPFRKYALEGQMVLAWMQKFYGKTLLAAYAAWEKELPLLAVGNRFLLSHAEPARFYPRERVIGCRDDPEVVIGLTWTDNGEAEEGSVQAMLAGFLGEESATSGYYFGGHRAAPGGYGLRADGRFVQIHDPERFVIAHLPAAGPIHLDTAVMEIEEIGGKGEWVRAIR
jgi:hypothetical protein